MNKKTTLFRGRHQKLCLLLTFLTLFLSFRDLQAQKPTITSFSPTSGNIGTSVTITGTNFNASANQISMSIGNLDGDGKPDFSVANSGSAIPSLYFAIRPPMVSSTLFKNHLNFQ